MMSNSNILLKEFTGEQRIVCLSLNRPDQLNAINGSMLSELEKHLNILSKSKKIDALIISSETDKSFSAGIDVNYVRSLSNAEAANFFSGLANVFEQLSNFACPTISVINGYAFGAGADLALACDIRIAGKSASLRFPGPQFGVVLGTQRLVNEVGPSIARKLALTNELVHVDEATSYGLIHEVVNIEDAFVIGFAYAKKVAHVPKHALKGIQEICGHQSTATPSDYARKSVEQGDFQEEFTRYLRSLKNK